MADCVSIKHRIEQFDLKHGLDEAVKSLDGTLWLYPNGAQREVRIGLLSDPPHASDYRWMRPDAAREHAKQKCLSRQREYHATRLQRLTDEFSELKHAMISGHYTEQQLSKLQQLKQAVHACQAQLLGVERELADASPSEAARRMTAQAEQQRQERRNVVAAIKI